ncbi:hypothetical protein ES703_97124 [subsurface metagenome]
MDPIEEAVQQLKELNATQKKILEIAGLEFALEPTRYIGRKLRSGEAIAAIGFWYQEIGAGATVTIQSIYPEGYVVIAMQEAMRFSQSGVFEFYRYVDDALIPQVHIARTYDFDFTWAETLPFSYVIKNSTTHIITNHDVADQWLIGAYIAVQLRKDVWQQDSRLMDLAAERYIYLAAAPPPMAPPV